MQPHGSSWGKLVSDPQETLPDLQMHFSFKPPLCAESTSSESGSVWARLFGSKNGLDVFSRCVLEFRGLYSLSTGWPNEKKFSKEKFFFI
ncbi:hypothetical protein Ancab_028616 [Ancistrocladus abbreviatus]